MPREVADWSPNPEQLYNQAELRRFWEDDSGSAAEFPYGFCVA